MTKRCKYKMKNVKTLVLSMPFVAAVFFLIFMKDSATEGALNGLRLCGNVVLPAIFPFTVLTKFFFSSGMCDRISEWLRKPFGYVFGVSGESASVILLSLVGGYPVCTSLATELYTENKISRTEAEALIAYTNNATPSFIIGYIGCSVLQNRAKGILMYVCIISSALLYGVLTSKKLRIHRRAAILPPLGKNISECFVNSVVASCRSTVNVCGFIIVFSVIASAVKLLPCPISALLLLLCELTVGVESCTAMSVFFSQRVLFSLVCSFVSLSGLCVLFQVRSCCDTSFSTVPYIKGKLFQGIFSYIISFFLFPVFF